MIANNFSWGKTLPLRLAGKGIQWFVYGTIAWLTFSPASRPRRLLRGFLIALKCKVYRNPRLKNVLVRMISKFPGLQARLMHIGNQQNSMEFVRLEDLSPRARKLYYDIKEVAKQDRARGE